MIGTPITKTILTALALSLGTSAQADLLWPEDIPGILSAESDLRAMALTHADSNMAPQVDELVGLLDLPRQPVGDLLALEGGCRVRSLQAYSGGVFVYPFFPCTFEVEYELEVLRFEKTSGSQRRFGIIREDVPDDAPIFAGGSYYSNEARRTYSYFMDPPEGQTEAPRDVERDSTGFLYRVADDHLLLIFAARNGRSELYDIQLEGK